MIFYLIGVDYKTADITRRENACNKRNKIACLWKSFAQCSEFFFTCNRAELYGIFKDEKAYLDASKCLAGKFPEVFRNSCYKKSGPKAIKHLLELACGLHSQILGEKEIIKQLNTWLGKISYSPIKLTGIETLTAAQQIRNQLGISGYEKNISDIVFQDIVKKTGVKTEKNILIIGTGSVAKLFAANKSLGLKINFISHKRNKKARGLAQKVNGGAFLLKDLEKALLNCDILISATSSPKVIIESKRLEKALKGREKDLYVYDLALPRDIDPKVKKIKGIYLMNLDDLEEEFKQHNKNLIIYKGLAKVLIKQRIKPIKEYVNECNYKNRSKDKLIGV